MSHTLFGTEYSSTGAKIPPEIGILVPLVASVSYDTRKLPEYFVYTHRYTWYLSASQSQVPEGNLLFILVTLVSRCAITNRLCIQKFNQVDFAHGLILRRYLFSTKKRAPT